MASGGKSSKNEKNRIMTHKSTSNIQNIEQKKRRKRCEEIREQAGALQKERNLDIVTEM